LLLKGILEALVIVVEATTVVLYLLAILLVAFISSGLA
jgi:hypothetical protein